MRNTSAKAPTKPSATPTCTGPIHAHPFCGTSDGQISTLRSSQKPSSTTHATPPRITGVFFGRWPSSTQKGVTQQHSQTKRVSFEYGSVRRSQKYLRSQVRISSIRLMPDLSTRNWLPRRALKNCVSSGRLPYQITRYCAKKRYIQKIENAKINFPMSCMRDLVICPSSPGELRCSTNRSAVAAGADRWAPHAKYAPNRFEYQVGVSDITWSKQMKVQPIA